MAARIQSGTIACQRNGLVLTPFGAPALGTLREGDLIEVTGTDFGVGPIIQVFDDFESGTLGDTLAGKAPKSGEKTWSLLLGGTGRNNASVRYDDEHVHHGTKSLLVDWALDNASITSFGFTGMNGGVGVDEVFISYARYQTGDYLEALASIPPGGSSPEYNRNHKQFYLYGTGAGGLPNLMPILPANGAAPWSTYTNDSRSGSLHPKFAENLTGPQLGWAETANVWQRWSFEVKNNSGPAIEDGVIKAWIDGQKHIHLDNYPYQNASTSGKFDDWRLGHMCQQFSSSARAWFDEVYFSIGRARVIVSTQAVYDDSVKHVEAIQVPATWETDRARFNIRRGALPSGVPLYAHVINHLGQLRKSESIGALA